jgi:para-aminobenzoate synthetase / 4-amino-4-deoxychorismate lyase
MVITTGSVGEVLGQLGAVERLVNEERRWAAGFMTYEAAPAFDPALKVRAGGTLPLVWFGIFDAPQVIALPRLEDAGPAPTPRWAPSVASAAYKTAIRRIKHCIRRGETYQVNYTFRLRARIQQTPWKFFLPRAAAHAPPYGAFVAAGEWALCSFSPELFFSLEGADLVCRPMKGTASRGLTWEEDQLQAERLHQCPKNRAENIMIVDMVRNDLGKIATTGSVEVNDLFAVEKHPTLWQMTSTVQAKTRASWVEILRALFPPASITGAPKARTMRIISDLESAPRGVYTGCIGFLGPGRRARFSVAIRTAQVQRGGRAAYGVGGGITWDSLPEAELEEAFTKARVVLEPPRGFQLIETLLWTPAAGYHLLAFHLERLRKSADYFAFPFSERAVLRKLTTVTRSAATGSRRVRLLLNREGAVTCAFSTLDPASRSEVRRAGLAKTPVNRLDPFLYHKTSQRETYDAALASRPGCDDVILWNERGELTESCLGNLVLEFAGKRYTPPVSCGLLAGTYRAWMLREGLVRERVLGFRDLRRAQRVFLVNSVRGLQEVRVVLPRRLPDSLVTEIEHESNARRVSKSDVVRERLRRPQRPAGKRGTMRELLGDLIGSVEGLPSDLASKKKKHLPALIRAKKLHRR